MKSLISLNDLRLTKIKDPTLCAITKVQLLTKVIEPVRYLNEIESNSSNINKMNTCLDA